MVKKIPNFMETEKKLNLINLHSLDIIFERRLNSNWTIIFSSHQIENLTGYPAEDFISDVVRTFASIIHPEDILSLGNTIEEIVRHKRKYELAYRIIHRSGETRWICERGEFDKTSSSLFGIIHDITKITALEHIRQENDTRFLSLMTALNKSTIVARTDLEGKITYVNEKFCQTSKYTEGELLGKDHRILNSGYHSKKFFEKMWEVIKSGETWRGHVKNKNKNGEYYWVDTTIAPTYENDELKGFITFRYEITSEKKQLILQSAISKIREDYMRHQKDISKFFTTTLNILFEITESKSGALGQFNIDIDGSEKITLLTPLADEDELKMRNIIAVHIPNNPGEHRYKQSTDEVLASGEIHIYKDFLYLPINYSKVPIAFIVLMEGKLPYNERSAIYLAPLLDVIGEIIYSIKLEEELKYQTKISQHNSKMATIGTLASGVGHEINNPLAIIRGYVAMAQSKLRSLNFEGPDVFELLGKVDLACDRIANIVKGLRTDFFHNPFFAF